MRIERDELVDCDRKNTIATNQKHQMNTIY